MNERATSRKKKKRTKEGVPSGQGYFLQQQQKLEKEQSHNSRISKKFYTHHTHIF